MEENFKISDYFIVEQFMAEELGLKNNELLIYAIIFGFSRIENQTYRGGISYLMKWTGITKKSVITCLNSLVDKGYIVKQDYIKDGIRHCEYHTTYIIGVKTTPSVKSTPSEEITPQPNYINNNIYNYNSSNNNIEEIKEIENNKLFSSKKERNFTKPTL